MSIICSACYLRFANACCPNAQAEQADGILEHHEFSADESDILKNPLVVSTKLFLEQYLYPSSTAADTGAPRKGGAAIISLSGGG